MTKLTEADIIRLLRETYDQKLEAHIHEIDVSPFKGQSDQKTLASPMLKVRHKKTGLLYTIKNVQPNDVLLSTPEGNSLVITYDELEKDYDLD